MDYTGLIVWLAFYTSNPSSGFIFCPQFVFNYSRLTVTFISCLCHDPLSNTKGLLSKPGMVSLCWHLFIFSVMVCHFKSCPHCLFNTPPLCCPLNLTLDLTIRTYLSVVPRMFYKSLTLFCSSWQLWGFDSSGRDRLISEWRASGLELGSK